MPLTAADQRGVHAHCSNHRGTILSGARCGCFYCERIFDPSEIVEWIDESTPEAEGQTALCPHCGIDSVIPDRIPGVDLTPALLEELNGFWFKSSKRRGGHGP